MLQMLDVFGSSGDNGPGAASAGRDGCWHTVACLSGIVLSLYALFVEVRKHQNPKYVAVCDFGKYASCSRVLASPYSRGFGIVRYMFGDRHFLNIPNCTIGLVFYSLQLLIEQVPGSLARHIQFDTCLMACIGSVYLAYVLMFVLHDLCLVCISTYLVNGYLLYDAYKRVMFTGGL